MESKLTQILSSVTVLGAWAYSLGWIRTSYYFRTFGVGLESVEYSVQDYLFVSWYVLQNVVFFVFLLWIALTARRKWVYGIVGLYLLLPYLVDSSYSHLSSPMWGGLLGWLVAVPHSILKFIPFLVLGAVYLVHKDTRTRFGQPSWPHGSFFLVVLSIVIVAWSISAAKHFGSSEANDVLRDPTKFLLHVKLHTSETAPDLKPIEAQPSLYLLYSSPHRCILLNTSGFEFGHTGARITILYVSPEKIELIEGSREVHLDPGRLFW